MSCRAFFESLIRPLKIAEFVNADGQCNSARASVALSVESPPRARREIHCSVRGAFLQDRCHENPIAQQELIMYSFITLMGKSILQGAHCGFAA
jgi:hypothetical protein